jgi:hypothetical protein
VSGFCAGRISLANESESAEYLIAVARGRTAEIAGTAESLEYVSQLLQNLRSETSPSIMSI